MGVEGISKMITGLNAVIPMLETYREAYRPRLGMGQIRLTIRGADQSTCGCFASHFKAAVEMDSLEEIHHSFYAPNPLGYLDEEEVYEIFFDDGAREFAGFLGFDNSVLLTNWLEDNPHLWGNDAGSEVLENETAWREKGEDSQPLTFEDQMRFLKQFRNRLQDSRDHSLD